MINITFCKCHINYILKTFINLCYCHFNSLCVTCLGVSTVPIIEGCGKDLATFSPEGFGDFLWPHKGFAGLEDYMHSECIVSEGTEGCEFLDVQGVTQCLMDFRRVGVPHPVPTHVLLCIKI